MAMLGTSHICIHGQDLTVDSSDNQVQAAMALLLSNASAQAARAATLAAAGEPAEASDLASTTDSVDVVMEKVTQPEKRKAEDPLDDRHEATQAGGGLAERLAGACSVAVASIAAQGLQGDKRAK